MQNCRDRRAFIDWAATRSTDEKSHRTETPIPTCLKLPFVGIAVQACHSVPPLKALAAPRLTNLTKSASDSISAIFRFADLLGRITSYAARHALDALMRVLARVAQKEVARSEESDRNDDRADTHGSGYEGGAHCRTDRRRQAERLRRLRRRLRHRLRRVREPG
jgi:hypothetical protein